MMKLIIAAAITASIGLPSVVGAQAPAGSIVCRTPAAGETANGTVNNAQLVCKPVNVERVRTAMMAVMNDSLTAEQKAKMTFAMSVLQEELQLKPGYPGFNGNPNN